MGNNAAARIQPLGDRVVITLQDNGIGIAPEYHEEVFGMFRRLHTNDDYVGTGMGLAIVRRILESCGGSVRIEQSDRPGTRFVIELSAAVNDDNSAGRAQHTLEPVGS